MLKKIILDHVLAEPGAVALIAVLLARIDSIILFALRFFPASVIKAELDRLDKLADAEVDKEAALPPAAPPAAKPGA